MDHNKLYSKSELFRKHYSPLKKYVKSHGLKIERGVTRAKLARQLIDAGIYKKPKTQTDSPYVKDKSDNSNTQASKKQRKQNDKKREEKLFLFKRLDDLIIVRRRKTKKKRRFCAKGKAHSTNDLLKKNAKKPVSRKRSRKIKSQSPTYERKSKQSFEMCEEGYSAPKRSAARSNSREVPGTPPPSLGFSKRTSSNKSRGGAEVPGSPEFSLQSYSAEFDSELSSHSSASFSRSGSNRSIGGGHITDKRTPESDALEIQFETGSSVSLFSFSSADTDPLPTSETVLKRDPSSSSRHSLDSESLAHACVESSKQLDGENPTSRDRLSSGRNKQRDSITLNEPRSMKQVAPRNTKKTLKGTKKRLRNTKKGRRRRKKKQKKRLADLNAATGERSSHDIFGDECDGWPDIPPRPSGERNTIHADPLTPRKVRPQTQAPRLPDTHGINEIKAQLSEDMKGKDMNIESLKMYLGPLLGTGGLKRMLSDEESVFIQEINSRSTLPTNSSNVSDSMASLFLESINIPLYDNGDSEDVMTPDTYDSTYFKSNSSIDSLIDIQSQSNSSIAANQFSHSVQDTNVEPASRRKCLVGKQKRLGGSKADLQKSRTHSMRAPSEYFDDLIVEVEETLNTISNNDSSEEVKAPLTNSEPRRKKKYLRQIKQDDIQAANKKDEAIENVARKWIRGSSVDGFYFDIGDKVEFEGDKARVLSRRKTDTKVTYEIIMDDTQEEIIAPESELVYGMVVSIRRRTLSRQSQSPSTQSSMSSSQFFRTCTDPSHLNPEKTTYHSFRSRGSRASNISVG